MRIRACDEIGARRSATTLDRWPMMVERRMESTVGKWNELHFVYCYCMRIYLRSKFCYRLKTKATNSSITEEDEIPPHFEMEKKHSSHAFLVRMCWRLKFVWTDCQILNNFFRSEFQIFFFLCNCNWFDRNGTKNSNLSTKKKTAPAHSLHFPLIRVLLWQTKNYPEIKNPPKYSKRTAKIAWKFKTKLLKKIRKYLFNEPFHFDNCMQLTDRVFWWL